ncbi:right-handed parallel beta-helix repeat-containing protein [Maribacter luteus]|uniref:Right-handed parallel beta-helix repeat-containing protein n=1 Tax=Maribacter luteus TaxID=2594478 RepID=A0A6I2MNE4_9FLAO|nr:right-handed parallel beta-helix repeat-containing protein [Maribacter luteus]MRX65383.1 right-handed parallel beta-helix repeat-containing protein [Maribacter luteus]
MNTKRFFVLIVTILLGVNLSGKDLYVSVDGNDAAPGTKDQPLASLYGARDLIRQLRESNNLKEEIRVIISGGTYFMNEPLELTGIDSGSDDFPVVFIAANSEEPVFVGGIQIENWEKVTDELWKAKVPEVSRYGLYFEQLYVNGNRAVRAKSPNEGFYYLKEVEETVIDQGKDRIPAMAVQNLKLSPPAASDFSTFSKNDYHDALVTFYHKWDNTRKRVTSFSADSSAVCIVGTGMKPWNKLDSTTRFTIENYEAALDTHGEWYLQRNGDLFYMPRPGENMADVKVYAPLIEQFLVIKGSEEKVVRNLRFENLRFEVAGYRTPLWGNEAAQAAAPIEAVVMLDYAQEINFSNCRISHTGTNAFWFRKACANSSVTHCYLNDLGAGGIKIGDRQIPDNPDDLTRNITIDNNIIRSGGYVFPCAVGVTIFHASDSKISHNEIADFRYSGISVGWVYGYSESPSKRNTIEYNHIHHLGWGDLSDMGGVYCLGKSEGTSVSNNVIHHVYSYDYGGWGLYTDEGSTGIMMESNLVYACKNSAFHQHFGKENTIKNNIFAANLRAQLEATRVEEHLSFSFINNIVWFNSGTLLSSRWGKFNIHTDKNCYWDTRTKYIRFGKLGFKEWQASGKDRNSIIADPDFVDPQNFDFRIRNKVVMRKIGFKPFDYTKAGVYGSYEWKELARFDPELADHFDETVKIIEQRTNVQQ